MRFAFWKTCSLTIALADDSAGGKGSRFSAAETSSSATSADSAASAIFERLREEARAAIEARDALLADHETLLEVLGEKTETCDALGASLRAATADALDFERVLDGRKTSVRRSGRRDAYFATLTHAAFAGKRVELEPADD